MAERQNDYPQEKTKMKRMECLPDSIYKEPQSIKLSQEDEGKEIMEKKSNDGKGNSASEDEENNDSEEEKSETGEEQEVEEEEEKEVSEEAEEEEEEEETSKGEAVSNDDEEVDGEYRYSPSPQRKTETDTTESETDESDKEDFPTEGLLKELHFLNTSCERPTQKKTPSFQLHKTPKKQKQLDFASPSPFTPPSMRGRASGSKSSPRKRLQTASSGKAYHTYTGQKRLPSLRDSPESTPGKESVTGEQSEESEEDTDKDEDEEGALTIVAAEEKPAKRKAAASHNRARKRVDEGEVPQEVIELIQSGIDEALEEKARRTHLTAIHVKNIIKNVMTDENVVAMMRNTVVGLQGEGSGVSAVYEPTLTRARTKELLEQQAAGGVGNIWAGLSSHSSGPSTTLTPETQALATLDFPDEDEDDEYRPEADDQLHSDDESLLSKSGMSDCGSPATPRTPLSLISTPASSCASIPPHSTGSGVSTPASQPRDILKLPPSQTNNTQRVLSFDKEVVSQRTRSKLPLTETPLECLEMAFKPPDVTKDMYETELDDDVWKKFLIDFIHPLKSCEGGEEEEDPEYNILEDAEDDQDLREEMRGDRAVQIPRREIQELMTELLDTLDTDSKPPLRAHLAPLLQHKDMPRRMNFKPQSGPPDKSEPDAPSPSGAIWVEIATVNFNKSQLAVLQTQMIQHTQLLATSAVMASGSLELTHIITNIIILLDDLKKNGELSDYKHTFFWPPNLEPAFEIVEKMKKRAPVALDTEKLKKCSIAVINKLTKDVVHAVLESTAFPYPHLLPVRFFQRPNMKGYSKTVFVPAEDGLLALGLEKYLNPRYHYEKCRKTQYQMLMEALEETVKTHLVAKTVTQASVRIKNIRTRVKDTAHNPVWQYLETGQVMLPQAVLEPLPAGRLCQVKNMPEMSLVMPYLNSVQKTNTRQRIMKVEASKIPKILIMHQASSDDGMVSLQPSNTPQQPYTLIIHPTPTPNVINIPAVTEQQKQSVEGWVGELDGEPVFSVTIPPTALKSITESEKEKAAREESDGDSDGGDDGVLSTTHSSSTVSRFLYLSPSEDSQSSSLSSEAANPQKQHTILTEDTVDKNDESSNKEVTDVVDTVDKKSSLSMKRKGSTENRNMKNKSQKWKHKQDSKGSISHEVVMKAYTELENKGELKASDAKVESNEKFKCSDAEGHKNKKESKGSDAEAENNEESKDTDVEVMVSEELTLPQNPGPLSVLETPFGRGEELIPTSPHNVGGVGAHVPSFFIPEKVTERSDTVLSLSESSPLSSPLTVSSPSSIISPAPTKTRLMSCEECVSLKKRDLLSSLVAGSDNLSDSSSAKKSCASGQRSGGSVGKSANLAKKIARAAKRSAASLKNPTGSSEKSTGSAEKSVGFAEKSTSSAQKTTSSAPKAFGTAPESTGSVPESASFSRNSVSEPVIAVTSPATVRIQGSAIGAPHSVILVPPVKIGTVCETSPEKIIRNLGESLSPSCNIGVGGGNLSGDVGNVNGSTSAMPPVPGTTQGSITLVTSVYHSPILSSGVNKALCPLPSDIPSESQIRTLQRISSAKAYKSPIKTSPMKQVSPILRKYHNLSPRKRRLVRGNRKLPPILPKQVTHQSSPGQRKLAPKPSRTFNTTATSSITTATTNTTIGKPDNTGSRSKSALRGVKATGDDEGELLPMDDDLVGGVGAGTNTPHRYEDDALHYMDDEDDDDDDDEEEDLQAEQQREEHLAALLKASSTISLRRGGGGGGGGEGRLGDLGQGGRRLSKQQKRLQARITALATDSDTAAQDKFMAQSYLMRVREALTAREPALFRKFIDILNEFTEHLDRNPVELYDQLSEVLKDHPQLLEEFVAFLMPQQAIAIGKYAQFCAIHRMRDFLDKLNRQFGGQPQYILKIMRQLQMLQNQPNLQPSELKAVITPLLRYPHLVECFTLCFPSQPPPPSLPDDFEDISLEQCDTPDSMERVELGDDVLHTSPSQCACLCHARLQPLPPHTPYTEHCQSCAIRFSEGRVYLQCGKTLRPAKVTYQVKTKEEEEEKDTKKEGGGSALQQIHSDVKGKSASKSKSLQGKEHGDNVKSKESQSQAGGGNEHAGSCGGGVKGRVTAPSEGLSANDDGERKDSATKSTDGCIESDTVRNSDLSMDNDDKALSGRKAQPKMLMERSEVERPALSTESVEEPVLRDDSTRSTAQKQRSSMAEPEEPVSRDNSARSTAQKQRSSWAESEDPMSRYDSIGLTAQEQRSLWADLEEPVPKDDSARSAPQRQRSFWVEMQLEQVSVEESARSTPQKQKSSTVEMQLEQVSEEESTRSAPQKQKSSTVKMQLERVSDESTRSAPQRQKSSRVEVELDPACVNESRSSLLRNNPSLVDMEMERIFPLENKNSSIADMELEYSLPGENRKSSVSVMELECRYAGQTKRSLIKNGEVDGSRVKRKKTTLVDDVVIEPAPWDESACTSSISSQFSPQDLTVLSSVEKKNHKEKSLMSCCSLSSSSHVIDKRRKPSTNAVIVTDRQDLIREHRATCFCPSFVGLEAEISSPCKVNPSSSMCKEIVNPSGMHEEIVNASGMSKPHEINQVTAPNTNDENACHALGTALSSQHLSDTPPITNFHFAAESGVDGFTLKTSKLLTMKEGSSSGGIMQVRLEEAASKQSAVPKPCFSQDSRTTSVHESFTCTAASSNHTWTKDEDRMLLVMVQERGTVEAVFRDIAETLPMRDTQEVMDRFNTLVTLMMVDTDVEDSVSKSSDDSAT